MASGRARRSLIPKALKGVPTEDSNRYMRLEDGIASVGICRTPSCVACGYHVSTVVTTPFWLVNQARGQSDALCGHCSQATSFLWLDMRDCVVQFNFAGPDGHKKTERFHCKTTATAHYYRLTLTPSDLRLFSSLSVAALSAKENRKLAQTRAKQEEELTKQERAHEAKQLEQHARATQLKKAQAQQKADNADKASELDKQKKIHAKKIKLQEKEIAQVAAELEKADTFEDLVEVATQIGEKQKKAEATIANVAAQQAAAIEQERVVMEQQTEAAKERARLVADAEEIKNSVVSINKLVKRWAGLFYATFEAAFRGITQLFTIGSTEKKLPPKMQARVDKHLESLQQSLTETLSNSNAQAIHCAHLTAMISKIRENKGDLALQVLQLQQLAEQLTELQGALTEKTCEMV